MDYLLENPLFRILEFFFLSERKKIKSLGMYQRNLIIKNEYQRSIPPIPYY